MASCDVMHFGRSRFLRPWRETQFHAGVPLGSDIDLWPYNNIPRVLIPSRPIYCRQPRSCRRGDNVVMLIRRISHRQQKGRHLPSMRQSAYISNWLNSIRPADWESLYWPTVGQFFRDGPKDSMYKANASKHKNARSRQVLLLHQGRGQHSFGVIG